MEGKRRKGEVEKNEEREKEGKSRGGRGKEGKGEGYVMAFGGTDAPDSKLVNSYF